jgi:hypothetical protein
MMNRSPWLVAAFCFVLIAVNSGCLFTRHTTNVVRKNEKPRPVGFESAQAKNIFDGKVAEVKAFSRTEMSNPRVVAVPFLLWYSSTDVVSDNGIYNDQVAICDTNGDGIISLAEATTYAARVDEQTAKREAEKAKMEAQNGQPTGPAATASARDNAPLSPNDAARPISPPPNQDRQAQAGASSYR